MDGYQTYPLTGPTVAGIAPESRSFLFLQGPISTFFDRLGRALLARGHHVNRINLHFGDQLLWRLPALNFRGRFEDWRSFVANVLDQQRVTHVVLHGDRRPYHVIAAEEARARGIAVIATDLGYIRPDWITLEHDGMTTYSRFPRDPAEIRNLAASFPEPDLDPRFHTPFWMIAGLDVAYNLGLVFGGPLYPRYRYHSIVHPFAEYAGWLWSRSKGRFTTRAATAAKQQLQAAPHSYFLVPLQLATDYQIRAHSPFRNVREAVRTIVASFAASGSARELVFVAHPLDNGLINWKRLIGGLAREYGIADRVSALGGGTPIEVLGNAAGVVTINSTIGVTALHHNVPVKVLGNAVFDIAGLTCQEPLDAFWHRPPAPDRELMTAFLRALAGATQVKGGYYQRDSQDHAINGVIERFEQGLYPLAPLSAAAFAARPPRPSTRTVVVTGATGGIGLAMARAHATPGVTLCLIGDDTAALARTAEDCRQRGALVETLCPDIANPSSLHNRLTALDRVAPIDTLVVDADTASEPTGTQLAERNLAEAMTIVAAVMAPMRHRRRGDIVFIGGVSNSIHDVARRATTALQGYAAGLRRRLRGDGVLVTVVAPGRIALGAGAWLGEPRPLFDGADRIAARTLSGVRRRRKVVGSLGAAELALRLIRVLPSKLRDSTREIMLNVDVIGEATDEAPLAGKSATGD